jgi:hypothetical protein
MSSATTFKEKRGNSRRCHTDDNLPLGANLGTDSVVDKGLPSTPWAIEEEYLLEAIIDRVNDLLKSFSLATIEAIETVLSQFCLLHWVIPHLLCNVAICNEIIPVHLRLWHVRICVQRRA